MIAVFHQASRPVGQRQATARAIAAALALSLAACSQDLVGPAVDLYHNLQGGEIAQQRPPPPGAHDPYPNLGSIPARPAAPDIATQQRMADQLAAERDAAERAAAASPLPAPPAGPPKPAAAPPAAPSANANQVVVDAAPAPKPLPAPSPPSPAPPTASPLSPIDAVAPVPAAIASGPLPVFAATPPPTPAGLGLAVPSPPPAPLTRSAPPAPPAPANTVAVSFTPGSAILPPSAALNLRRFALAHRGVPLTVTGRGEAAGLAPDAQAAALQLALQRAQAIAASLAAAGVPAANLRLRADAAGTGGLATL